MYCENCGQNNAYIKCTQIVNGNKIEMFLCEECSKELGIDNFNIQMDFSTFLSDFLSKFEEDNILPKLLKQEELKCKRCNSTFEDFISTGRFGCPECYTTYEEKIDPLLRSIQGANRHIGRLGKIDETEEVLQEKDQSTQNSIQIEELNKKLKGAIKEERYEEAAIIRDKIKELEGEKKC